VGSVVVTGAAGFLGSHLVDRLLERRAEVWGVDNLSTGARVNLSEALRKSRFHFTKVDLVRTRALPRAGRYYHLASPASPRAYQEDPLGTLRVNAEGTRTVLESARRNDGRTLIASTSEVYGDPEVHPQPETYWGHVNPVGVRSCYDEGKRYAEALAMSYRRMYGMDIRIARIFNTYGPRMDPDDGRVVSNFIVQGLRGQPFTIYGTGSQARAFCYVSDLVDGLLRLMSARRGTPTPMNLGNPREFRVIDTARLVARALRVPFRLRRLPLPPDDPRQRSPDITLARRHLRWEPRVSFEQGLELTTEYFRRIVP
jgi:UDP-glucuronate decarboxylase